MKRITAYKVVCDKCGERLILPEMDKEGATYHAEKKGWAITKDKVFCDLCNPDETIVKRSLDEQVERYRCLNGAYKIFKQLNDDLNQDIIRLREEARAKAQENTKLEKELWKSY